MEHLDLPNGFSFDCEDFYKWVVEHFPTDSHFVEIGLGQGKSSAYLAVEIINSEKNIKLDCIDCWDIREFPDSDGTIAFKHNLKPIWNLLDISVTQNFSVNESNNYKSNSLDFVFIDGDHSYNAVTQDIEHWLPKIKQNGIIAGHDYTNEYLESVVKAVDDYFTKLNTKVYKNKSCWYVFVSDIKA